jgi:hypothetical protein
MKTYAWRRSGHRNMFALIRMALIGLMIIDAACEFAAARLPI